MAHLAADPLRRAPAFRRAARAGAKRGGAARRRPATDAPDPAGPTRLTPGGNALAVRRVARHGELSSVPGQLPPVYWGNPALSSAFRSASDSTA